MPKRKEDGLPAQFAEAWARLAPRNLKAGALVAVSGGADSMTLAHLMHAAGIRMAVAHAAFGLRGADSDADETHVRDWAEARNLKVHTRRFETIREMAGSGEGVQATARRLRYEWFDRLCEEEGYGCIVTAHHADDNAETFLLNLLRGAGLVGLGGIPEKRGRVIRPLLGMRRDDLRAYATQHGISFRHDASNDTDDYRRNALRHRLMPLLEELSPGATDQIAGAAVRLREAHSIYAPALQRRIERLVEQRDADLYISVRGLASAEPQATLAHEIFSPAGFTSAQMRDVLGLLEAVTGAQVSSATHRVIRHRVHLVLSPLRGDGDAGLFSITSLPATVSAGAHQFLAEQKAPPKNFGTDSAEAWLNASALRLPLVLRRARAGDYFYPFGMDGKKKKVARFLTSLKVPRHEKEAAWVLESEGRIAWLCGYRIDERFKLSASTKAAVHLRWTQR